MPERELIERLDAAVEAMLHGPETARVPDDRELAELWRVAADLTELPRPSFRARLKADVERRAAMASAPAVAAVPQVNVAAAPMLTLKDPAAAIEFYERAFGAVVEMRLTEPGGAIAHAEITIGGARVMLSHEYADLGYLSAETLGGSPIGIHLYVDDVDALVARAAAAGATVLRQPSDEFYGDRAGSVRDPFGIKWLLATRKHEVSVEEMQRRLDEMMQPPKRVPGVPEGFRSLTPYLVARGASGLIDFMKQAFGAAELLRVPAPDGTLQHASVRIGDSMVELSDGSETRPARPAALHLFVEDVDATYARAAAAGATTIFPPSDRPYGVREADVKDAFGNNWYIATPLEGESIPEGLHTVTPTLHVLGTGRLIEFIKQAFGAEERERHEAQGVVMHASLKLGDSVLELGEARPGFIEPMPCAIHYYVADVDAVYARALQAGATSLGPPSDRPYGDRGAELADPFGNHWFIATQIEAPRKA
jgi:PhnB protein